MIFMSRQRESYFRQSELHGLLVIGILTVTESPPIKRKATFVEDGEREDGHHYSPACPAVKLARYFLCFVWFAGKPGAQPRQGIAGGTDPQTALPGNLRIVNEMPRA